MYCGLKIRDLVSTISIIFLRINWPNFLNNKGKSGQKWLLNEQASHSEVSFQPKLNIKKIQI